jgi:hypothetical protein
MKHEQKCNQTYTNKDKPRQLGQENNKFNRASHYAARKKSSNSSSSNSSA